MRRSFIAGNWKMNLNRQKGVELAGALAKAVGSSSKVEVAVCPPYVYIDAILAAVKGSAVGVGGQNMYHEAEGAFTGEISAQMLKDIGCKYVIIGHSERRQYFGETNEGVNRKLKAALAVGLSPIVCVGETLAERDGNKTAQVIEEQFNGSFADITADQAQQTVIAYEPVWAIGTGRTASPEQAEEVHLQLRTLLAEKYGSPVAEEIRLQYGGSVKASNAKELLAKPNIDGALVGGAALKAEEFLAIIAAAKQ